MTLQNEAGVEELRSATAPVQTQPHEAPFGWTVHRRSRSPLLFNACYG